MKALENDFSTKSPWPLYQQVKHLIIRRINSGHWQSDTKVPSENELVDLLGISRMTINRAIRELSAEGYLYRKKGAGTFVRQKKPQFSLLDLRSIAEEIKSWGGQHSSQIVHLKSVVASFDLLQAMKLKEGSEVFNSLLVHKDNGMPIQVAERFVNPKLAPDFINQDFSECTPNEYLLKIIPVTEIEHVIETQLPDRQTQELLNIRESEPCLILHRTTWHEQELATKNRFIYVGSKYTLGGRFKTSKQSSQLIV